MTRTEEREVTIVNISIKKLIKELSDIGKKYIKKFFSWLHIKLTALENWLLKKIDKAGQKASAYLEERLKEIEITDNL